MAQQEKNFHVLLSNRFHISHISWSNFPIHERVWLLAFASKLFSTYNLFIIISNWTRFFFFCEFMSVRVLDVNTVHFGLSLAFFIFIVYFETLWVSFFNMNQTFHYNNVNCVSFSKKSLLQGRLQIWDLEL